MRTYTKAGEVHGWSFESIVQPTVTAGAYSAGDIMGGLLTFSNIARVLSEPVIVTGVGVMCKADVAPNLKLVLFNADPTNTTKTDNAAYSLHDDDVFKVLRVIDIQGLGGSWYDHGGCQTIGVENLGLVCAPTDDSRSLYGLLIDSTGVTLASTSDIQVRLRGVGV